MSSVIAPELLRKRRYYKTLERETYLRQNSSVSLDILAADMRLPIRVVYAYMRQLGLRKCRNNRNKE